MSGLVILFCESRVLPLQGLDDLGPVIRLQPTKGVRFRTVVRVEDADEGRQPRRGDRELAQDPSLLVPGQHVPARSGRGRGDWRRAVRGQNEFKNDHCGRSPRKNAADEPIASVSMRSPSTSTESIAKRAVSHNQSA